MKIEYKGDYFFLSNSYHTRINERGRNFTSVEAAHLSYKNKRKREQFEGLLPSEARELANNIEADEDWKELRLHYLYNVTVAKFMQNLFLQKKLLNLDTSILPDDDLGNILVLTKQFIVNSNKVNDIMEEQKSFNFEIFE